MGEVHGDDDDDGEGNPKSSITSDPIHREISVYQKRQRTTPTGLPGVYKATPNTRNGAEWCISPDQTVELGKIYVNGVDLQSMATVEFTGSLESEKNGNEWHKLKTKTSEDVDGECSVGSFENKFASKSINMQLGGNVWLDVDQLKVNGGTNAIADGRKNNITRRI